MLRHSWFSSTAALLVLTAVAKAGDTSISAPTLPDDMTVVILKTGKKPAKVVVHQETKRWEATDGELNNLPAPAQL